MAAQAQQQALTILRRPQVQAKTGLSRSTLYDRIKAGCFPRPIKLGGARSVGWLQSDIDDWITSQINASRKAA